MVSEYDAFGPWIYEIDDEHPIPELFAPLIKKDKYCLMMMKIPRQIERRDADPGMQLYDYVVGAFESQIFICIRQDNTAERKRFRYSELSAISLFSCFLASYVTFYFKTGESFELPFNTISLNIMKKFVKLVRSKIILDEASVDLTRCPAPIRSSQISDVLFINLLNDIDAEEDRPTYPGAFQQAVKMSMKGVSLSRKLASIIYPPKLAGGMHLYSDRELIIIERDSEALDRLGEYGYQYIYLPAHNITGITVKDAANFAKSQEITITLDGQNQVFRFFARNSSVPDYYRQISTALIPHEAEEDDL